MLSPRGTVTSTPLHPMMWVEDFGQKVPTSIIAANSATIANHLFIKEPRGVSTSADDWALHAVSLAMSEVADKGLGS